MRTAGLCSLTSPAFLECLHLPVERFLGHTEKLLEVGFERGEGIDRRRRRLVHAESVPRLGRLGLRPRLDLLCR